MKKFPCTSCGACCRSIKYIDFLKEYDRGDGCCKYLGDDNLCAIYKDRPLLCNIEKAYLEIFSNNLLLEDYYLLNAKSCNELQEIHQIDKSFRLRYRHYEKT
ncbi:MAG: hypothetical protein K0S80_2235 [Neobacillus sp.]|nr:hypothetical protein [Neobacillus sp.]